MERRSRKRYLSDGSEKMERVGDRWGKIEWHCSTGHSPQCAVAPMEDEDCLFWGKDSVYIFYMK